MDHLRTLSLTELKQYASALRAKIKEKGGSKSTDPEVPELRSKLASAKSIIADKEIKEAEEEATRRHIAEALKGLDRRTYRPMSGKPASPADRKIPEELMHRTYVPGETQIGNIQISVDEILQSSDESSDCSGKE